MKMHGVGKYFDGNGVHTSDTCSFISLDECCIDYFTLQSTLLVLALKKNGFLGHFVLQSCTSANMILFCMLTIFVYLFVDLFLSGITFG